MALTRTLAELLVSIADRADITIASGARHTPALVTERLNRAVQRWGRMVAECGDDLNLQTVRVTTETSTTRDARNWAPCQYIDQPDGLVYVRSIDIWPNGTSGRSITLDNADELERGEPDFAAWLQTGNPMTGTPRAYRLGGHRVLTTSEQVAIPDTDPVEYETVETTSFPPIIQLFPWANAVYTMDVRYIAAADTLEDDDDTVDFIAGGEEWVVNDVALQSKIGDELATPGAQMMRQWNQQIETDLRFMMGCRGFTRRQDTFGRRRDGRWNARWWRS